MNGEAFSVYQYFKDGSYEQVRAHVGAEEAVTAARHYTQSVGAKMGVVDMVKIVADADDSVCFQWEAAKGITFPPEAKAWSGHAPSVD
jgi:hypothetical protein